MGSTTTHDCIVIGGVMDPDYMGVWITACVPIGQSTGRRGKKGAVI